jgi:hypothetical protein
MSSNEIFGSNRFENNPSSRNIVFQFELDKLENLDRGIIVVTGVPARDVPMLPRVRPLHLSGKRPWLGNTTNIGQTRGSAPIGWE